LKAGKFPTFNVWGIGLQVYKTVMATHLQMIHNFYFLKGYIS